MAKTKNKKAHYDRLFQLGCIICRKLGVDTPPEIHHIKNHTGMGRKEPYNRSIPLCGYHHRLSNESYHHSPKSFSEKWGSQEDLLKEVMALLKRS